MTHIHRFFPFIALPLVAGCASTGDYPSLAQRPAERVEGTFTPDTAPTAVPAPPAPSGELVARLAELTRSARALDAEFREASPQAERLVAAAGATGSDSWATAQVALANLDSLRSRAAIALADLDALWVDATLDAGAREPVGSARDSVEALLIEQDTVLARLRGRL